MKTTINCLMSRSPVTRFRNASLAAALLLLAGAGLCQASSNVTVTAQNLGNSQVIYTLETNPIASSGCGEQSVTAPSEIATVSESGVITSYGFLFWDINAQLYTNPTVKFQPVCGAANSAVAVYWPLGGCAGCPPATTDSVIAYSLNEYKVIAGVTPIASASSGWTAGSTTVTPPSTIEALPKLPPYGEFKAWDALFHAPTTSSSLTLTEPGEVVVGFYGYPDPDPCQPLRNELQACLSDGLGKACVPIGHSLQICENTYGE
jgi:hypothetical protein